jgi:flagellar biosynthesis protein FlhG
VGREPRPQDWEVLGLDPGADVGAVRKAYARRKALYGTDGLATYSLHDDGEREALLERLDDAYRTIIDSIGSAPVAAPRPADLGPEVRPPSGPAPPLSERPGAYLRHQRQSHRVRIDELALETKIRASLLDLLEAESFRDLPAPVYVRGFVIQYARALKLHDAEALAEAYLAKMRAALGEDD